MRAALTASEQLLWSHIRGRRLRVVFRRQVPLLGRFIADFLAPAERLVVEVDGAYHAERARADARRDAALARAGYRVFRVEAELVSRDTEAVLARIRAAFESWMMARPATHVSAPWRPAVRRGKGNFAEVRAVTDRRAG